MLGGVDRLGTVAQEGPQCVDLAKPHAHPHQPPDSGANSALKHGPALERRAQAARAREGPVGLGGELMR